jgi:hypothetical protein
VTVEFARGGSRATRGYAVDASSSFWISSYKSWTSVLVGISEGRRQVGRSKYGWGRYKNISVIVEDGVYCIIVACERVQWCAAVIR